MFYYTNTIVQVHVLYTYNLNFTVPRLRVKNKYQNLLLYSTVYNVKFNTSRVNTPLLVIAIIYLYTRVFTLHTIILVCTLLVLRSTSVYGLWSTCLCTVQYIRTACSYYEFYCSKFHNITNVGSTGE